MRMDTRKLLALLLSLALFMGALPAAVAQENAAVYQLGDRVEDFTVTMTDGQDISLYGLLAEKKVVVLNFWASWCGPCKMEFPYLQETYDKLSADVGFIALSINEGDTVEVIESLKAELGVTTVPTGRDIGLAARFGVNAYPTSIVIDKNGVICLMHEGMVTSSRILENALEAFIADDYDKPLLLAELPSLPVTQAPDADQLSAALNAQGGALEFVCMQSDETLWPFLPTEDGNGAAASNAGIQNSTANVMTEVDAKAGDVLLYDVRMNGLEYEDRLLVMTGEDAKCLHTGSFDWTTNALRIEADGTRQVAFAYVRGNQAGYDAVCELRNVRLLTGDEAAAYEFPVSTAPKTLEGKNVSLDVVDADGMKAVILMDADGNDLYGEPFLSVVNQDSVRLKLCIGADVEESLAALVLVTDIMELQTVMLSGMEHDDEGYFYTLDLAKADFNVMATLRGNVLDTAEMGVNLSLCANEAKARDFLIGTMIAVMPMMTDEQIDAMGYYAIGYEDGTVICDSDDVIAAYKKENAAAAPETLSFTITFTDGAGVPIPGVMAQICDDTTCTVLPSDENGVVKFDGENHSYELHVLVAPAGYEAPTDSVTLPASGGEVSVVLATIAK